MIHHICSVDTEIEHHDATAEKAFADNPMWKPASWFPTGTGVEIQVDPAAAAAVLRERAPGSYRAPVDATVAFDSGAQSYVATPAEPGEGLDVSTVTAALQSAFDAGTAQTTAQAGVVPVDALVSTEEADAAVAATAATGIGTGPAEAIEDTFSVICRHTWAAVFNHYLGAVADLSE